MKQRYEILKNEASQDLKIREYAELDKDTMSLLCEETYPLDSVISAASNGKEILISTLRTRNMYPIGTYAEKIAAEVIGLIKNPEQDTTELVFDDIDFFGRHSDKIIEEDIVDEEDTEIDDLLEEDVEDEFDENIGIDKLKSGIRVADDEPADLEDDS